MNQQVKFVKVLVKVLVEQCIRCLHSESEKHISFDLKALLNMHNSICKVQAFCSVRQSDLCSPDMFEKTFACSLIVGEGSKRRIDLLK